MLFVVFLKFSTARDRASEFMDAHKSWLQKGFSDGVFLAAGSLEGGQGGGILATGCSREALEARVNEDPFVREGVVTAGITGFTAGLTAKPLDFLKEIA